MYWDTDWNKQWTVSAFKAMAQICKDAGDTCYGVELLNEPDWHISRDSLKDYYQDAIKVAREQVGLDKKVPIVIMDWMHIIQSYWNNRWQEFFPESTYGKVIVDTHIYDFKNTVQEEE